MAELNPEDLNHFSTGRRRVNQTYDMARAQNDFQKSLANNAYSRNFGSLAKQYDRMRERMPYGYAKRGLLNSGVWGRALGQFSQDRVRSFGDLLKAHQDATGGLDLAADQLFKTKENTLADIESAERARLDAVAAALRAATGG